MDSGHNLYQTRVHQSQNTRHVQFESRMDPVTWSCPVVDIVTCRVGNYWNIAIFQAAVLTNG